MYVIINQHRVLQFIKFRHAGATNFNHFHPTINVTVIQSDKQDNKQDIQQHHQYVHNQSFKKQTSDK